MQKAPNKNFTELEQNVMFNKATERAFTGKYDNFYKKGDYACKNCDTKLYSSKAKFDAGCGWPAFDDTYTGAVKQVTDNDGLRVEILCNNCGIHLGNVFKGEQITDKNTRHCVNSVSIKFVEEGLKIDENLDNSTSLNNGDNSNINYIIVGAGCFWGVEYYFKKLNGVIKTTVGYSGGDFKNPTYQDVLSHKTGHQEVIKVEFDTTKTNLENVLKYLFNIHDFTQTNGQGNDIGDQYLSVIYYKNDDEKLVANNVIELLESKGYKVATDVLPEKIFYSAETYHQDYYGKNGQLPYCHFYKEII